MIALTNIQRFSIHDGPGIRTTIFLKGCSLRCPWCSNPENVYGSDCRYYEPDELLKYILKDRIFYDSNPEGGVTFSGGEALLQIHEILPLLEMLKRENVNIAAETCLYVPHENLALSLEYIDIFYADIKIIDSLRAKDILRSNLNLYLENLNALIKWRDPNGKRKPVVIRVPVIGGFTDDENNRHKVKDLLKVHAEGIIKIELIKEHNLALSKYRSLGIHEPDYRGVSDGLMNTYREELLCTGLPVEICKV